MTLFPPQSRLAAAAIALIIAGGTPAFAEMIAFRGDLKGANEVPPVDSQGTGTAEVTLDTETKVLTWTINYSGLTGDAAAAHFHGPAAVGANAGPVVPIEGSLASPISGSATLTDQQIADLQGGLWYFNIHTAQYPDGELRGQLVR
jgi:hypothetical protein